MNNLIDEGWLVLYEGFDKGAFQNWQSLALMYLTKAFGPDHSYTRSFRAYVQKPEELSVLIGGGILEAAREEFRKKR